MKRRIFTILSTLSLALGILLIVLWIRSHWASDAFVWSRNHDYVATSHKGDLSFLIVKRLSFSMPLPWPPLFFSQSLPQRAVQVRTKNGTQFVGYYVPNGLGDDFPASLLVHWSIPYWILVTAAIVLPCTWFYVFRVRVRKGCCRKCGYDLRASKERCPECGTPIPVTK